MTLEFGYDKTVQTVSVPEENLLGILEPNELPLPDKGEEALVREALAHPIGAPALRSIVKPGEKIVIVSSDISRPMPTWKVMPALLDALYDAGVYVNPVLPPATPATDCLLRTSYMATHTEALLDEAMDIIGEVMSHE